MHTRRPAASYSASSRFQACPFRHHAKTFGGAAPPVTRRARPPHSSVSDSVFHVTRSGQSRARVARLVRRRLIIGGEMVQVNPTRLKLLAAVAGVGALITMGAVTMALGGEPGAPANVVSQPEPTLGQTVTTTTPPPAPETSIASPTVTASTPEGFGMG
jgi:hypothetical protein